jgi:hypothetical protein
VADPLAGDDHAQHNRQHALHQPLPLETIRLGALSKPGGNAVYKLWQKVSCL